MRLGRRFLVDIDTIFDTRIGWAKVLQPDVLEKLDLEVYRMRFTDAWAEVVEFRTGIKSSRSVINARCRTRSQQKCCLR